MAIEGTGYIPRNDFAIFADIAASGATTPEWELIGDKVEELALEMNPNVKTVSDVTGVTTTILDKYEVKTSVSPMRAKRESKLFGILYAIVKDEKTLSDVERTFLCVNIFDKTGTAGSATHAAWTQKGVVAVQSYGGGTAGLDIPFDIHWTGGKIHGSFNPATKAFTANA